MHATVKPEVKPGVIIRDGKVYRKAPFDREDELRTLVEKNYKLFFGEDSLYLPKEVYMKTPGGAGTAPDGIAINPRVGKWYLVEVERKSNGVWSHIVPQAIKHLIAAMNSEERKRIRDLILKELKARKNLGGTPGGAGKDSLNAERDVDYILKEEPTLVIIIDGVPSDLESFARLVKADVLIVEVEKFESEDGDVAYKVSESVAGLTRPVEEEADVKPEERMTRDKFLGGAMGPLSTLYSKAEELAQRYPELVKIEYGKMSASLKLKISERNEYRTLFTIYQDAFYILKHNFDAFSKYYGAENLERFINQIKLIRAVYENYNLMKQPRVNGLDLTKEEAETIISALEEMIAARQSLERGS